MPETIKDTDQIQVKIKQLHFLGILTDEEEALLRKLMKNDSCTVVFEQTPIVKKQEVTGQEFEFVVRMVKRVND